MIVSADENTIFRFQTTGGQCFEHLRRVGIGVYPRNIFEAGSIDQPPKNSSKVPEGQLPDDEGGAPLGR